VFISHCSLHLLARNHLNTQSLVHFSISYSLSITCYSSVVDLFTVSSPKRLDALESDMLQAED
jgi:hypothetical protein